MKKILLALLILTFPFSGLSAQFFNLNGINYRLFRDPVNGNLSAKVITMGDTDYYKGDIEIPSSVNHDGVEYPVTAIDYKAFRCCNQLTSIVIPASVTDVPAAAFHGCYNLRTIVVSDDNDKYDSRDSCNAVIETATNTLIATCENTVVPKSVSALGDCAFFGCKSLTSLTIDGQYTKIGRWVFLDCENIEYLNWYSSLPLSSVTKLLSSSLKEVVLGDSVNCIGDEAFKDCKNLSSITIPSTVKTIAYGAFAGCDGLTSITIPDGVEYIGNQAFKDCKNLLSVTIPSTVISIGREAFAGCEGLKTITIPYSIESIDNQAFRGCDSIETLYWNSNCNLQYAIQPIKNTLKTIIIGNSVKTLDLSAFYGCKALTSIVVTPDNTVFDSRSSCNAIIESASNKMILGCKTSTIPEGVTDIASNVFTYCSAPKNISLPSTLLSIADNAFSGCDSLTTLVIPANVNRIGNSITSGCYSLTSLSVDPANNYYDSRNNCNAIIDKNNSKLIAGCNSSTVPEGVISIASNAFSGFAQLKSVIFPSSLKVLEDGAFEQCVGLESVSFPSAMERIGSYAFAYCYKLLSVKIPSSIKTIEPGTFMSCDTLISIDIPSGVEIIGDNAFTRCRSLKSIRIPSTVKEIGSDAFNGCVGMHTAGPQGGGYDYEFCWETIPANAFAGLSNLESVYIPKTVKAIYETPSNISTTDNYRGAVFEGCSNLKSVTVSFKDTKLYRYNNNGYYRESDMNYSLYMTNPVCKLTVLDDTIISFFNILTDEIKELVISKDVNDIAPDAFAYHSYTTNFSYWQKVYDEWGYYYDEATRIIRLCPNMENINVEAGNSKYSSNDGVLFNIKGDELLAYPAGREGDYRTPATIKVIQDNAFYNSKISSIVISKNVEHVGDRSFESCDSLKEVTIEGSPAIGYNAFGECNNIQGVWTRSAVPGLMNVFDEPKTIITNDFSSAQNGSITLNIVYDSELGRNVTEFSYPGYNDWQFGIYLPDIPAGNYKLSIGVLPSIDEKPVYIHPYVNAYTEKGSVRLLDSIKIELIDIQGFQFEMEVPYYMTNDVSGYDTLTIGNIEILEGYLRVMLYIQSGVFDDNSHLYSSRLLLDRIYIEPLDKDVPVETYAGTFTANVFNNATLYVPDGAIETYKAANGWKLFKNIAVNDRSYPADEVEVSISDAGYATFYYSDGDYVLPDGLSAMVVSGMSDDRLEYTTIASGSDQGVVPAGVPVILASDSKNAGVYKLTLTDPRYEYVGANLLIGSDVATQTYAENSSRFYKLAYGPSGTDLSDVLGWYWGAADGGAFNIEAHKAWLALPAAITHGIAGFSLSRDNTTFVIGIEAFDNESDATIYDLYGRKLSAPNGTGIIIINGKKVIINE